MAEYIKTAPSIGQGAVRKGKFRSPVEVVFRRVTQRFANLRLTRDIESLAHDGLKPSRHLFSSVEAADRAGFLAEARDIFTALDSGDREPLDRLLGNRRYLVVIGPPRSGGSYLSRTMNTVFGSLSESDGLVRNESLPRTSDLRQSDSKAHRNQAVFELIQWILQINRRYGDVMVVPKKCSGFMYDMRLAADFFGSAQVTYLVTLRHPSRILESAHDSARRNPLGRTPWEGARACGDVFFQGRDVPDWWAQADDRVRTLFVWHELYRRTVDRLSTDEASRIVPVPFGKGPETLLSVIDRMVPELAARAREEMQQQPFILDPRPVDPFWHIDMVRAVIEDVKAAWTAKGCPFEIDPDKPV